MPDLKFYKLSPGAAVNSIMNVCIRIILTSSLSGCMLFGESFDSDESRANIEFRRMRQYLSGTVQINQFFGGC